MYTHPQRHAYHVIVTYYVFHLGKEDEDKRAFGASVVPCLRSRKRWLAMGGLGSMPDHYTRWSSSDLIWHSDLMAVSLGGWWHLPSASSPLYPRDEPWAFLWLSLTPLDAGQPCWGAGESPRPDALVSVLESWLQTSSSKGITLIFPDS